MENKPTKPHLKISIIDIIIIAIVIIAAVVLLMVWRSSGKSSQGTNDKTIHYTIELSGMVSNTAKLIKQGDTIIDSDKKYIMGTVEEVTYAPTTTNVKNLQTGDTVQAQVPEKLTATVKLVSTGSATDAQILAGSGYTVRVGAVVHAAGPGYAGIGYIIGIDREGLGK